MDPRLSSITKLALFLLFFHHLKREKTLWAYDKRAQVRMAKGDTEGAMSDYTKAIELDQKDPEVYEHRGSLRKAKGDQKGAEDDFAIAKKLKKK